MSDHGDPMNILYFFLSLLILPASAFAQPPVSVTLSTHNLCPYGCYDETGHFNGHAVRVIRHALQQMDIPLEIVVVPWQRAQYLAEIGKVDGYFAASINTERDANGVMSAYIADQKWDWYLLKESNFDPTSPDFKEMATVTSFFGANMLKWLKTNNYNVTAPPPTTEALAKMLLFQRFDAALANKLVMDEVLDKNGIREQFKQITLMNKPLGVYFTKRFVQEHPDFLSRFNRHVEEYRRRTELAPRD